MVYKKEIIAHYESVWGNKANIKHLRLGPFRDLPVNFCILEFPPTPKRNMWTYATCCMSQINDALPIELHMFSSIQTDEIVELLTAVAHYHRTGIYLNLNHTVNFGKPWQDASKCDHGFISLPYLDGPDLEDMVLKELNLLIKFYWLVPVTSYEVDYAKQCGVNALEQKFESAGFNYLDIHRKSVV